MNYKLFDKRYGNIIQRAERVASKYGKLIDDMLGTIRQQVCNANSYF
jgi:hypothetical protein